MLAPELVAQVDGSDIDRPQVVLGTIMSFVAHGLDSDELDKLRQVSPEVQSAVDSNEALFSKEGSILQVRDHPEGDLNGVWYFQSEQRFPSPVRFEPEFGRQGINIWHRDGTTDAGSMFYTICYSYNRPQDDQCLKLFSERKDGVWGSGVAYSLHLTTGDYRPLMKPTGGDEGYMFLTYYRGGSPYRAGEWYECAVRAEHPALTQQEIDDYDDLRSDDSSEHYPWESRVIQRWKIESANPETFWEDLENRPFKLRVVREHGAATEL